MSKGILDDGKYDVYLFCISLSKFSRTFQFIICSLAVTVFYTIYGYILELIFTLDGMKSHGWYLTLVQFAFYSVFALLQLLLRKENVKNKIPLATYISISALTVGTMGFSNSSMGYLNYPTQVIFKSCKLIPVMIGSVIILRKSYNCLQVTACLCMCVGLVWFTLADSALQPKFSLTGVVFVCLALLCDAIIGNVQEGAMQRHVEPATRVILYSYSIGFCLIALGLAVSGELFTSLDFSFQHPYEVYGRCVILSMAGFCGVQAVLFLVYHFGALIAVTVTTFRKAISICLSFLMFSKPFTIHYAFGGLLVALGIYINIYAKNSQHGSFLVLIQRLHLRVKKLFKPKGTDSKSLGLMQV